MSAGAPFAFVAAGAYATGVASLEIADEPACHGVLDRADALRDDPAALAALWSDGRVVLLDAEGHASVGNDGALFAPTGRELSDGPGGPGAAIFLGRDPAGTGWFALDAELTAAGGAGRLDLRTAAARWPAFEAGIFAQARALQHWRQRHRHCGACGAAITFTRGGWQGRCEACGSDHYPRTDPAVIVAVTDGRRLLLGRQRGWPARRHSVLAGFVEPGETLEQTVAREVLEEAGVRVRGCRYLGSQPWPFPGQLMLGFIAIAEPDTPVTGDELESAAWFEADEIRAAMARDADDDGRGPLLSTSISISRWLVTRWLDAFDRDALQACGAGGGSR
ncbi:NAD(+) diphosphatase [Lysobacter zhanggongensis]|uniref:NAD(+) diphosphatase n=1 Tax=Lysobacter zhanggongensis TaxID=1774951 RepID=A0ABU7YPX8_9GAMM